MLYYTCERSGLPPTWPQLEHAIKRNFGGLESKKLKPFREFEMMIAMSRELPECSPEMLPIINPDCSRLGLIKTSLDSRERTWHGENRYVLFLTENYAALDILKNPKNYNLSDDMTIARPGTESNEGSARDIHPFILFGSSFPKDKVYTQVCRNINQIKICMETGRTVILLNQENLYESLYDVLNQYYIYHADSKYVDLGLQTHTVRCRVHDNFKLILIAEKTTVYEKFPTPLINRLEKHFVHISSILEPWQEKLLAYFEEWINNFSSTSDSKFKRNDAFIGFQKDTPASVVFHATNMLRSVAAAVDRNVDVRVDHWADILEWSQWNSTVPIKEDERNFAWQKSVLNLSKFLLLQTAAPDAIVRLERTELADEKQEIEKIYFQRQYHSSIEHFLCHHVHEYNINYGLLMQVTTHSHLLSQDELKSVKDAVGVLVFSFFLHEFDTELNFTNKVSPTFKSKEDGTPEKHLVIIQCDSGHLNGDLIACARYRIYDLKVKADKDQITHVLFIIHLPHQVANSSFVGFQGNPWVSYHIDDLRRTGDNNMVTASEKAKVVPHYNVLPETDAFITEIDQRVNLEDEENMETTSHDVIMEEDIEVSNDRRNDINKVNVNAFNTEVDQQVNLEDKGNMETTSHDIIEEEADKSFNGSFQRGQLEATEAGQLKATEVGQLDATEAGQLDATEVGQLEATEAEQLEFLNACKDGHYSDAEFLLENFTSSTHVDSYDGDSLTALMCASKEGHYEVVKLLLKKGAQVDLQDSRGWSALMYASQAGHYRVANLLLEYSANVDLQASFSWESSYNQPLLLNAPKISTLLEEQDTANASVSDANDSEQDDLITDSASKELPLTITASQLEAEGRSDEGVLGLSLSQPCEASSDKPVYLTSCDVSTGQADIVPEDLPLTIPSSAKEGGSVKSKEGVMDQSNEKGSVSTASSVSLSSCFHNVPFTTSTLNLLKWVDSNGCKSKFFLFHKVSARWKNFGRLFGLEEDELDSIEKGSESESCWFKVMNRWLSKGGTARYPATWRGLLTALEDTEYDSVARELEMVLSSVISPTTTT